LAADQVALATAQAVLAGASAEVALAASNYKGAWSDCSGAANIPYCVSHNGQFWQLTTNLADVSAKTPGVDAEWIVIQSFINVIAKTADATLTAAEMAGNVVATNTGAGGAVELTLPAGAANLALRVIVTVAQYLKITAAGTDKFRYGTVEGAAGGYVRSNVIGTSFMIVWSGANWCISDLVETLKYDE
jgi:hypothetical protein